MNEHPEKQLSTTDPDSRLLKTQGMTRMVCYNVQSAVETKHHLIVAHDVTNTPDRGRLCSTAVEAQAALGQKDITVLADKGYYSGVDIKDTMDAGMTVLVPKGDTSGSEKKGIFNRSQFHYDAEQDAYVCPAKQILPYRMTGVEKGQEQKKYWASNDVCRACEFKPKCSNSPFPRRLSRWVHQDCLDEMDALKQSLPDSMLIRKQTVEHPFGTIKSWMGATHFLTRGFENVRTEMNLHVLAYNLKRMISIFGTQELIKAMQT